VGTSLFKPTEGLSGLPCLCDADVAHSSAAIILRPEVTLLVFLEVVGKWAAERLLNAAGDSASDAWKRPEVLLCFEASCGAAAKEFPELFSQYTSSALSVSPDDVNLADRLQKTFGTRDFPRPRELSAMLLDSWRCRRAALRPSDAAPLFQKTEMEVTPFIDRLSELFFRELANNDQLRNPFIVSVLQEMMDAFLNVGARSTGLALWPINGSGMNVVRHVEDNDEPNGNFYVSTALQLLPGSQPIDLLQFQAVYWANGCPCLNLEPMLKIGDDKVAMLPDDKTLKQPIRLPASGISLRYSRQLRPPLQKDTPEECDYGDLSIVVSYREASRADVVEEERLFKFLPGGALEPIPAIRPVPRLSDEQLTLCFESGGIDQATLDRLLAIDPINRYMGARSDVGENFVQDRRDLRMLRKILTEGCGLV
jgi:hypothetical protein